MPTLFIIKVLVHKNIVGEIDDYLCQTCMDLRSVFEPVIIHQLYVLLTLSARLLEWIRYLVCVWTNIPLCAAVWRTHYLAVCEYMYHGVAPEQKSQPCDYVYWFVICLKIPLLLLQEVFTRQVWLSLKLIILMEKWTPVKHSVWLQQFGQIWAAA